MFTGIVEALGKVAAVREHGGDRRLLIETPAGFLQDVAAGDSIAAGGVCLTAAALSGTAFEADVSAETLAATTAESWAAGRPVNLERAATLGKPLGGHLVSGHVDGVGRLARRREDARSVRMTFELSPELARYVARKGSIAVDGVSLTVNAAEGARFEINLVPHTLAQTTLASLKPGDSVNIEVDLIARYLERLLQERQTA